MQISKLRKSVIISVYSELLEEGKIEEGGVAHKRMKELQRKKEKGFSILDWRKNASK